jgi:hypothetical protein
MTLERVEPEGPAAVGQGIFAWTLCRRLRIDGEILEVDVVRHACTGAVNILKNPR